MSIRNIHIDELKMRLFAQNDETTWDWVKETLPHNYNDSIQYVQVEFGSPDPVEEDLEWLKDMFPNFANMIESEMPWIANFSIYTNKQVFTYHRDTNTDKVYIIPSYRNPQPEETS